MELRDYLRILRGGWLIIAACVVVAVGVATAVTLAMTPQYSSTSRLYVTTPLADSTLASAHQGNLFTQQRVRSYADLVESEVLAERVIDTLSLSMEPAALAAKVNARVVPDTVLMDIWVTDPSPEDAQTLTATYADEFIVLVTELETPPAGGDPIVSVSVVNAADLPTAPISPQPARNLALAGILGLLLGVGLVILRDALDTSVASADELATGTGSPTLATVGYDPDAPAHPLLIESDPRGPRAEAFRQLRTNMQFIDVDSQRKVFVVTSSVPGEGKTTTATNLALAMAETGQRVVLIEGDLRRPRVAEYLGLVDEVGITNVLVGSLDLPTATQSYGTKGLTVLASGPIPPNPSELLQSQAMSEILAQLERESDVVIIDAPPLLPVTDAAILTSLAGGALLVVRHGKTTQDQVRQSIASLANVDGRLLGTVLNMAPTKSRDAYAYGYGYASEPASKKPKGSRRRSGRSAPRRTAAVR